MGAEELGDTERLRRPLGGIRNTGAPRASRPRAKRPITRRPTNSSQSSDIRLELERAVEIHDGRGRVLEERLEGHTDSVGSEAYNLDLSQRRAEAVRGFLTTNGVEAARTAVRGFGESRPVASNESDAGRQQNRRVEVVILDPGKKAAEEIARYRSKLSSQPPTTRRRRWRSSA